MIRGDLHYFAAAHGVKPRIARVDDISFSVHADRRDKSCAHSLIRIARARFFVNRGVGEIERVDEYAVDIARGGAFPVERGERRLYVFHKSRRRGPAGNAASLGAAHAVAHDSRGIALCGMDPEAILVAFPFEPDIRSSAANHKRAPPFNRFLL